MNLLVSMNDNAIINCVTHSDNREVPVLNLETREKFSGSELSPPFRFSGRKSIGRNITLTILFMNIDNLEIVVTYSSILYISETNSCSCTFEISTFVNIYRGFYINLEGKDISG